MTLEMTVKRIEGLISDVYVFFNVGMSFELQSSLYLKIPIVDKHPIKTPRQRFQKKSHRFLIVSDNLIFHAKFFKHTDGSQSLKLTAVIVLLFLLGWVVAVTTTKVPQRRGVIAQCVFRSNFAIIGLPLAQALGGEAAMGTAAIVSAFSIPIFNVFAVIALSVFLGVSSPKKAPI